MTQDDQSEKHERLWFSMVIFKGAHEHLKGAHHFPKEYHRYPKALKKMTTRVRARGHETRQGDRECTV